MRAEQKAIDKRASREAEKLARLDEAAGLMLEGIVQALREDPEQLRRHKRKDGEIILDMLNGGNAAALAKALETLAGVIRDANGLPGKLDKERITDMRARRKLERQKAGLDRKDEDGGGVVLLPQVEEKADAGGMETAAQAGAVHGQAGV